MSKGIASALLLRWGVLLLVILVVAIEYGAASEVNFTLSDNATLKSMDLEDLQEKLSELHQDSISLKEYDTKEKVIAGIQKKEKEIMEKAIFEANVKAATRRREKAFGDIVHSVHVVVDLKSGYGKTFKEYKELFRFSLPNFDDLDFSMEPFVNTSKAYTYISYLPYIGYVCLLLAVGGSILPFPERVKAFLRTRSQIFITTGLLLTTAGATRSTAFEVTVDNRLVYSGLQSRRPPSAEQLRQILLTQTLLQDY